jgi:predicted transcriptional regulator
MTALAEKVEGLRMTPCRLRILRLGNNSRVGTANYTYLTGVSRAVWNRNAERLVAAGMLAIHEHRGLYITDKGRNFLRAKGDGK